VQALGGTQIPTRRTTLLLVKCSAAVEAEIEGRVQPAVPLPAAKVKGKTVVITGGSQVRDAWSVVGRTAGG
jgi:hypothetical protein